MKGHRIYFPMNAGGCWQYLDPSLRNLEFTSPGADTIPENAAILTFSNFGTQPDDSKENIRWNEFMRLQASGHNAWFISFDTPTFALEFETEEEAFKFKLKFG
jgi:hypothetical protein